MDIYIRNESNNPLPEYKTDQSAGMDLCAYISEDIILAPGESQLIPTGLSMVIDDDEVEAQVRPRSGLALKNGITVLNAPGTIDADYRGEIGVILINHSRKPFTIKNGDRIAQLVFCPIYRANLVEVDRLEDVSLINRGGGFGSTGV